MRLTDTNKNKSSILDTSLTELAFIFFFILLLVSVWKLNEQEIKLSKLELSNQEQKSLNEKNQKISELVENLKEKYGEDNFDEYFTEINKLQESVKRANELENELKDKTSQLAFLENKFSEIFNINDKNKIIEQLKESAELNKLIKDALPNVTDTSKALKQILLEHNDVVGQNNNLRQQIVKLGNGLVHPPCWADAKSGAIEFIYDITIFEDGVTFSRGWPDSRNEQALTDPSIVSVIGTYKNNNEHLAKTKSIFDDSVRKGCRHFVRISDKAISKDAFKKQLFAIETHFYKLLTEVKYGK